MSSDEIRLVSDKRTEFGKGAARKLRRAEKVPAVLYGHGEAPIHLALPFHDTFQALKNPNALLTIAVDGEGDQLALAKDVQRDPIKPIIEHVDLVIVKRGEKVTVEVPVHVEGDAAPETVVTLDAQTLEIEADVTNLPEGLTVSVEGLEVGTQVLASQVEMPAGATLVSDPELLVVNITQQISAEELEAELAEAEAEAGIEHDESDAEAAEAAEGESSEGGEESSEQE
ncbi:MULTISPECIES: 50S ribosomal protein L25/general stress protein Ctc [Janibacter]|uniref:50S ribosomal protein L25/general stress protein Ctc n=1 Tax=Janibacter TaxID=53457 RepID=UPI00083729B3|nr:50S ribosomal protein L25/general stress protein Ctc [Janibacter terrae]MBA4083349.1 50S ribosomal protein L25 [Kytococcus sp.]